MKLRHLIAMVCLALAALLAIDNYQKNPRPDTGIRATLATLRALLAL